MKTFREVPVEKTPFKLPSLNLKHDRESRKKSEFCCREEEEEKN